MQFKGVFIMAILAGTILSGCADEPDVSLPLKINAATFTLYTPQGWTLLEYNAYDSYVGEIAGPIDTVYFDFGAHSAARLADIKEETGTMLLMPLVIDGDSAVVHKKKVAWMERSHILLSLYIQHPQDKRLNHLFVINPANENLLMRIFRTHSFK